MKNVLKSGEPWVWLTGGALAFALLMVIGLLGLILGPMFELQVRKAMMISLGDPSVFVTRPISLTFLLLASGMDFISSFTAIIATINNAGPGLGVVGPASNYQGLTDFQTWVCSLAMPCR